MSKLKLTLACGDYDRTRALWDGRVNPEGIDLSYIPLVPEEVFWRMLQYVEFDISEMSLSNYLTERCKANPRFIAIPVFSSRMFRHGFIFINKRAGIKAPKDLKGKKVGIPEYSMTATVWLRGILQHEYGVAPSDMEWQVGGLEEPGREERIPINLPENVHLHPIPKGRTLNEMLANGEIGALITARDPSCFSAKHPDVDRLWPNYKEVEKEYYRKTKIFPIMHTVVVKNEIYDAYPWVAQSMYKAFVQAKMLCQEVISFSAALTYILPWTITEYESTVALMGEDFWPYGVEPNRVPLEAMTQYSYEQGLSSRKLSVEELFAPNTFKDFKI
jgi:4,5-dihydroxyphthalate decarboxylase